MDLDGQLEVVGSGHVEDVSPSTPLVDEAVNVSIAVAQLATVPSVNVNVASSFVRPALSYEQLAEFVYRHHSSPVYEIVDNYWPASRVSAAERQRLYDMLSVGAAVERRLGTALNRFRELARMEGEMRAKIEKLIDELIDAVVGRPPG